MARIFVRSGAVFVVWLQPLLQPLAAQLVAAPQDPPLASRLVVGVVGAKDEPGTTALFELLRGDGMSPHLVERAECTPDALRTADVVLVDWPASAAFGERLPLGPIERWDRPTVFLGDAGERFAQRWGLPTATEMAAMPAAQLGPEMQRRRSQSAQAVVWRQGHLFHFGAGGLAANELPPPERDWLAATVRAAAHFVSDRPVLRHGAPHGSELPAAERQRRERAAELCKALGLAPDARDTLWTLGANLDRPLPPTTPELIAGLVPESGQAGAARERWKEWLKPRADSLVWDPFSQVWRLDLLAQWRKTPSELCRDDQRGDGWTRDPAAVALAAKVVQRYGGRALSDLRTFSCRRGNVQYLWDRGRGYFRMEDSVDGAAGRANPWDVAVLDVVNDEDVIRGGGPPPIPSVSARSAYRELVESVFLPAMLLDPGTTLRRRAESDDHGKVAISVRLGGRGLDPLVEHVLLVDPDDGTIETVERRYRNRSTTRRLVTTAPCGLLQLPVEYAAEAGRRAASYTIEEPLWNPPLPDDLPTATTRLGTPRK